MSGGVTGAGPERNLQFNQPSPAEDLKMKGREPLRQSPATGSPGGETTVTRGRGPRPPSSPPPPGVARVSPEIRQSLARGETVDLNAQNTIELTSASRASERKSVAPRENKRDTVAPFHTAETMRIAEEMKAQAPAGKERKVAVFKKINPGDTLEQLGKALGGLINKVITAAKGLLDLVKSFNPGKLVNEFIEDAHGQRELKKLLAELKENKQIRDNFIEGNLKTKDSINRIGDKVGHFTTEDPDETEFYATMYLRDPEVPVGAAVIYKKNGEFWAAEKKQESGELTRVNLTDVDPLTVNQYLHKAEIGKSEQKPKVPTEKPAAAKTGHVSKPAVSDEDWAKITVDMEQKKEAGDLKPTLYHEGSKRIVAAWQEGPNGDVLKMWDIPSRATDEQVQTMINKLTRP